MARVAQTSSSETQVWCRIENLQYESQEYDGFRIRLSGTSDWINVQPVSGQNYTYAGEISGLSCGNTYAVHGQAQWDGTWYDVDSANASTSSCPTPQLSTPTGVSATTQSSNSINISWNSVSDASGYTVRNETIGSTRTTSSTSYTWSSLNADTTYWFSVKANGGSNYDDSNYSSSVSATTDDDRPNDWAWTTSQSNGHKISGATFRMDATEWNNFTNRINAFRDYKGLSNRSFSTAYSSEDFRATMLNQAISAISSMVNPGVSDKSSGDNVNASDLNTLMDNLNSIS